MAVYNRYKKLRKAIKYADGTIVYVEPAEYKKGELISQSSFETLEDCLYDPIYRWYQLELDENVPSTYICIDGNIYYKEVYQISKDGGLTWNNVQPEQYRQGDFYKNIGSCIDLPCDNFSFYVNLLRSETSWSILDIIYYNKISLTWDASSYGEPTPPFNSSQDERYVVEQNGWINIKMQKATPNIFFRFNYDSSIDINKISVPCFSEDVKQIILEVPTPKNNCSIDLSQIANQPLESLNNFIMRYSIDSNHNEGFFTVDFHQLKNLTNVKSMAYLCNRSPFKTIDLSNLDTPNNTTLYSAFIFCDKLEEVNLTNLNTSKVTDMSQMFMECTLLNRINFENFDTSNVTDMHSMFLECANLASLDLSSFNTSKVTNMVSMFQKCNGLTTLNLSNWNTSNVTNMTTMFLECANLASLDLSSFNTSKVKNMTQMFQGCTNLTSLDLSNFTTTTSTSSMYMFDGCNKLTHIKCKQAFRDWCIGNQGINGLPEAMQEGGSGHWEIVG